MSPETQKPSNFGWLIGAIAFPLFLIIAALSLPYLAIVRLLQLIGVIPKELAPTATWWGNESGIGAEIAAPSSKLEIAMRAVRRIAEEAGLEGELPLEIEYGTYPESAFTLDGEELMRVQWMNEQGSVIANVEIWSSRFDAAELLTRALAKSPELTVRKHPHS